MVESVTLIISLLLLLIIGMPIAFSIGITALVGMVFIQGTPLTVLPEVLFNNLIPFPLMAVPFFIIAANLMAKGGIAKALVEVARVWLGHLPGGMAIVSLLACSIFAAISGSSVATALAIGVIVIPAMIDLGYDRKFALGIVAAGGTLGILIPPSIPMIMYGFIAGVSTGKLFISAIVPAIVIVAVLIALSIYISVKNGYGKAPKETWQTRWATTFKSLPAIFMPVIILGGIYAGVFTPTEASIVAVIYALIIGLFVYKELHFKSVVPEVGMAMRQAGMLMLILGLAMVFGSVLTTAQIPQNLVQFVTNAGLSSWLFLIIICLILIILGCFMEVTSILVITAPILVPVVMALGIDPIHFGVLFVITMEIGLITPPIGMNIYVVSSVGNAPVAEAIKGAFPYVIALFIMLWVIAFIPQLSLWLPSVTG